MQGFHPREACAPPRLSYDWRMKTSHRLRVFCLARVCLGFLQEQIQQKPVVVPLPPPHPDKSLK